ARLSAEVFTTNPERANDVRAGHRYAAACAAARAADGQGQDASQLSESERTRLRKLAHDWLKADLAVWGRVVRSNQASDLAALQQLLPLWQQSPDLDSVRDSAALLKLPQEERESWQ